MGSLQNVKIKNLIVWSDNPRIASEEQLQEAEAVNILIDEVGIEKMKELAIDIFQHGLNSHRQPIVVPNADKTYNIYDGNRRVSVMKCVLNNDKRFGDIENKINLTFETELLVYITDKNEAFRLIENEHSGESRGKGQIPWDAFQRDYAYGQNRKTPFYPNAYSVSKICGLNKKSHFNKIPYTDLETVFSNQIIKSLFNIKGDWDFGDEILIKDTYNRLCNAKPNKPYSRYLPELKTSGIAEKFQQKLFPKNVQEHTEKEENNQAQTTSKDNDGLSERSEGVSSATTRNNTPDSNTINISAQTETANPQRRNTYQATPFVLFNWRNKGISISNAVFGPTLNFAIGLQINTTSEYRRIAPYLYRVLLEIALKQWCDWYKNNETKFNTGNLSNYNSIKNNLLGTTSSSVSFINKNKLKNTMQILEVIKDATKQHQIKELFKNRSEDEFETMVNELHTVVHGSKEFIDAAILKKYDEMICNCLVAISTSMAG